MDHRTAELLLELHASQYQASHPQATQLRHLHPMDMGSGGVPDGYCGDREIPSIEYTIEGENDTVVKGEPRPVYPIGTVPPSYPLHHDQATIAYHSNRSTTSHPLLHLPIAHPGSNTPEERTKILDWAKETLHKGRPPHPVILKLMEPFMKRGVSEPATLPSAIRRITSLPTYGRKEASSGENAVGEKAEKALSAGPILKGNGKEGPSGSGAVAVKAGGSRGGRSTVQQGGKKNKRAKRLSARLAGKDASGGDLLREPSTSFFDTKDADTASSLKVPPASQTQKTVSTLASSTSQPAMKRQHHCIRDGHRFKLLPLKKAGGKRGMTENKIGARKYKCGKCEGRIDETSVLMCGVELCGLMICGGCKRDWEILGEMRLKGA